MLLMRDINASGMCEWCNPAMGIQYIYQYLKILRIVFFFYFFLFYHW